MKKLASIVIHMRYNNSMYIEYDLIVSTKKSEFIRDINAAMVEGWQPIGGVAVTILTIAYETGAKTELTMTQAMGKLAPPT